MATDLEKQFFDTFGIEQKTNREYGYKMAIYNEAGTEEIKFYPQITDRILLELICIANKYDELPDTTTIKNIKDRTLRILIKVQKYKEKYLPKNDSTIKLPKTIRKIFKECEYDR
jgi:hypothetical protein